MTHRAPCRAFLRTVGGVVLAIKLGAAMLWAALLLVAVLAGNPAVAQTGDLNEYEVKSAFVYNFAKFTTWPPAAFAGPQAPVVLCEVGDSRFGPALLALQGKPVGGRRLLVRDTSPRDTGGCHLLLMGRSYRDRLAEIMPPLQGRPVLTISDAEGFAGRGGTIGLIVADGRVRFEVNLKALDGSGVTLSSQLLRLAKIVENAS